jgi:hypothetical protein
MYFFLTTIELIFIAILFKHLFLFFSLSVENNRRLNLLVSKPFLFIHVGQCIIVNVEITTQEK